MTIASAIQAKQQQVVDSYTAVSNKGGTLPATQNLTNLATAISTIPSGGSAPVITSLNVTPTTSAQTITAPSGTDGYSPVNVAAVTAAIDSDIKASNIKSGVSILGVTGNVVELNGETRTETLTSSAGNTFTPSSGKNAITSITVTPNNQARSVTPSTSAQTLNVNSGYSGNGTISVSAVTSSIDANIQAGNIKKDVQILGVTGSYEGSGGGAYQLHRVKDDYNNEIGTAYMEFEDANGNKYDVVCLDGGYRATLQVWCSGNGAVTNLPKYDSLIGGMWEAKETATFNTQKILDYCSSRGYTSSACTHCRNQSFVIGGVRYYGQLPNIREVEGIAEHYSEINNMNIGGISLSNTAIWTSTQNTNAAGWNIGNNGRFVSNAKSSQLFVCPVLEIPK